MTATPESVIHRKVAAGRDDPKVEGRTALRALRLGLARAARDEFGLPIAIIGATQARAAQEHLGDHVDEERMLLLLDGPMGATGAICIDRSSLAALTQQQTMGRVTDADPGERSFTGTDAAMMAPLVDALIKRSADLCDFEPDKKCLEGFRFGAMTANLRSLTLAVDAEKFRIFELQLDFAAGVRQGAMTLILPDEVETAQKDVTSEPAVSAKMERAVGAATAELKVVIARLKLSLKELNELKPDDVIPLVDPRMEAVELLSIEGKKVATAHLGQAGGWKAVRINCPSQQQLRHVEEGPGFETDNLMAGADDLGVTMDMPALPDFPGTVEEGGFGGLADLPETDAMPSMPDMPPMGNLPEPGSPPSIPEEMDFPPMAGFDDDADLPDMSTEDAAAEISALAGLSLDEEDGPPEIKFPDI